MFGEVHGSRCITSTSAPFDPPILASWTWALQVIDAVLDGILSPGTDLLAWCLLVRGNKENSMPNIERTDGGRLASWKPLRALRNLFRRSPVDKEPSTATFEPFEWNPSFNVIENVDGYRFSADVPGVNRDELEVTTLGNRLQISGKRESAREEKSETIYTFERQYGRFARCFTLPDDADLEHARSELADGVLTVVIPKLPESQLAKIPISTEIAS